MTAMRYEPAGRKNIDRTTDPYLPKKGSPAVGVCPICHVISKKKRWYMDEDESVSLMRSGAPLRRCPASTRWNGSWKSGTATIASSC